MENAPDENDADLIEGWYEGPYERWDTNDDYIDLYEYRWFGLQPLED